MSTLVASEELSRMEQLRKQVLEGSPVSRREIPGLRKDGSTILLSVTGSPIRNSAGDIVTICLLLRDIHERKRTEERLEEKESRFRIMADGCPAPMWMNNAEGRVEFLSIERIRS